MYRRIASKLANSLHLPTPTKPVPSRIVCNRSYYVAKDINFDVAACAALFEAARFTMAALVQRVSELGTAFRDKDGSTVVKSARTSYTDATDAVVTPTIYTQGFQSIVSGVPSISATGQRDVGEFIKRALEIIREKGNVISIYPTTRKTTKEAPTSLARPTPSERTRVRGAHARMCGSHTSKYTSPTSKNIIELQTQPSIYVRYLLQPPANAHARSPERRGSVRKESQPTKERARTPENIRRKRKRPIIRTARAFGRTARRRKSTRITSAPLRPRA